MLLDDSLLKAHMQPHNHLVVREYDPKFLDPSEKDSDETLLAIVGILSEATRQTNVAAWFRSGGLTSPPLLEEAPAGYSPERAAFDGADWKGLGLGSDEPEIALELETIWFDRPLVLHRWIEIGIQQLQAQEIDINARPNEDPVTFNIRSAAIIPNNLLEADRSSSQPN